MTKESDIIYESKILYVIRVPGGYEIRRIYSTHSLGIGTSPTKENALRCAKRLELYPEKLDQFLGR